MPEFSISGLWISPEQAGIGQTVSISAIVRESVNVSGFYEATLKINGVIEGTKKISVPPAGSEQIVFNISKKEAGTYSVDLDGLKGEFIVTAGKTTAGAPTSGAPASGSSGSSFPVVPVVIGAVAVLLLAGLLVFYLNKKRAR